MSVNSVFSPIALAAGNHVKSRTAFTEYYPGYGFFGQLQTLTTDKMFQVQLAVATSLSVTGIPVQLPMSVTLNAGWNWLNCPYTAPVGLLQGVPSFEYTMNDQIKSQRSFAQYYGQYGWFGGLMALTPGLGYQLLVASGGQGTFSG